MSTSSSDEGSGMVGHSTTSTGVESTGSLLFSVPSDYSSDVPTEITPSTSPALSEGKMRTPRDILDASRRLGQIAVSALQVDMTPTKPPKQLSHRAPSESVANDEAGYDADADGDGDGDGDRDGDADADEGARPGADATAPATRPTHRPAFLRIDTRQHRRVASMLAIRRPSPSFGDLDAHADIAYPLRARLAPLSSIRLKPTNTADGGGGNGGNAESYELQRRRSRPRAEPVGLGIGFPENHPLRSRAFTMPVPRTSSSPVDDPVLGLGLGLELSAGLADALQKENGHGDAKAKRQPEWLPHWHASPTRTQWWLKNTRQVGASLSGVCAPSPVRKLALRPTFLEMSPSPIEYLPGAAGAACGATGPMFRCDVDVDVDAHDHRSEVSERHYGGRHTMGMSECDAQIGERKRYATLVREGLQIVDLSESTVDVPR